MKQLSETAHQVVDAGDISNPELIKMDIQVRTGGGTLPPHWFMPLVDSRDIGPSKNSTTRSNGSQEDKP